MLDTYDTTGLDFQSLTYEDCSWDVSFILKHRPGLSTDITLPGQMASYRGQQDLKAKTASGFFDVGAIRQVPDISAALSASPLSGTILTSESIGTDLSLYMASRGNGCWAVVNGWLVNVSSTGASTDTKHNLITLANMEQTAPIPGTNAFVFLEVWKSVVTGLDNEVIKKYGNQGTLLTVPNDIYHDAYKMETARRVQIQYRIRTEWVNVNPHQGNLDCFNNAIKAWGASNSGTTLTFTSMASEGDAGLYRAGRGNDADKENLGTVDGYSYAIPMFFVALREESNYDPTIYSSWKSSRSISSGNSLRPDGKYAGVIYSSDIVDLRHRVILGKENLKETLNDTFMGIATGKASTTQGRVTDVEGSLTSLDGAITLKADKVASSSASGGDNICLVGTLKNEVARRTFIPGKSFQQDTVTKLTWVDSLAKLDFSGYNSTSVSIRNSGIVGSVLNSSPYFSLYDDNGLVDPSYYTLTKVNNSWVATTAPSPYYLLTLVSGTLAGSSYFKCDLEWDPQGDSGFSDVPVEMLEQRYDDSYRVHVNSVYGNPVMLYGRDTGGTTYLSTSDRIETLSVSYKDVSSFGQVLFLHRTAVSGECYIFLEEGMRLPGTNQIVLGVRSVRRYDTELGDFSDTYSNVIFNIYDSSDDVDGYRIRVYGLSTASSTETDDLEISFYLGTKYSLYDREANGVTETYETLGLPVTQVGTSTFYSFTTDDGTSNNIGDITGVCSVLYGSVSSPVATPYILTKAPVSGGVISPWQKQDSVKLASIAPSLYPMVLGTSQYKCSPVKITWDNTEIIGTTSYSIKVLAHKHSWYKVGALSGEILYPVYNTAGYQGMNFTSPLVGDILMEGDAFITTRGTGSSFLEKKVFTGASISVSSTGVWDFTFAEGVFTHGEISSGDYICITSPQGEDYPNRLDDGLTSMFKVSQVEALGSTGTRVVFENPSSLPASPPGSGVGGYIVKMDTPADGVYGIIARMPRVGEPDAYLYDSGSLDSFGSTTVVTPPKAYGKNHRMAQKGGVTVGSVGSNTKRGYYNLSIKTEDFVAGSESTLSEVCTKYPGSVTIAGIPYKILQPYLFKESSTGRLYMVVVASSYTSGSLLAQTSPYLGIDVVDAFELKGRPLLRGDN